MVKHSHWLTIIILLLFSSFASAAPPMVDFNFTPANPLTNQSITFFPDINTTIDLNILFWGFNGDGNVNYTRSFFSSGNLIFSDSFTGTNGTDLNVHNTDWNSVADSTAWSVKIQNNQMKADLNNDGSGGTVNTNLQFHDSTITIPGEEYELFFTFVDLVHTAGAGFSHEGVFRLINPTDGNSLINLRTSISTGGGAISLGGGVGSASTFSGETIVGNDSLKVVLTRKASNFIYDINFVKNDSSLLFISDQNINSDSFRYRQSLEIGGAGTGIGSLIIDDFNIMGPGGGGFFVPSSPIDTNKSESFSFSTGGNKTVCLTAGNSDGNTTHCELFFIGSFVTLNVRDENTGLAIQDANIIIDSISSNTNSNGDANVTTDGLSFPISILVSKEGYDDRTFNYNSLTGLTIDTNLSLSPENLSSDIQFQFFAPDQITTLNNQWITVFKTLGSFTMIAGKAQTSPTGVLTFNLAPQGPSYDFNIFVPGSSYGDSNVQYSYGSVIVTVLQPKEESNDQLITPNNFNVDVGGLGLQTFQGALPTSSIVILGNTVDVYTLRVVDENSDGQQYFARNYVMQTTGDVNVLTIQPYLININDGILVNLSVKDLSTNVTIPNIRIQMYTGINNVNTVVEDRVTDSAGIAQVVMLSQKTYNLLITSPNQDINYFNGFQALSPSQQNFTIWINFFPSGSNVTVQNTTIFITPQTTVLTSSSQIFDVNIDTNAMFDFIYVQAVDGNNTIIDQNNCASSPCNVLLTLNLYNVDANFLTIHMVIQNGDFNYVKNVNYVISPFLNNIVTRISNLKFELGPVSLGLIMFIIIFAVIGFLGTNAFGNNMSQIFLIVIVAGVFYFLWFIDTPLFPPFLAAVFGVMLIYFWSRQKGGP